MLCKKIFYTGSYTRRIAIANNFLLTVLSQTQKKLSLGFTKFIKKDKFGTTRLVGNEWSKKIFSTILNKSAPKSVCLMCSDWCTFTKKVAKPYSHKFTAKLWHLAARPPVEKLPANFILNFFACEVGYLSVNRSNNALRRVQT